MIFQHTIDQVLDGTKTQTRRIVKDWETFGADMIPTGRMVDCGMQNGIQEPEYDWDYNNIECVWIDESATRIKWRIGQTLAVQPGCGKKAVARIRLLVIRREAVQDISEADCKAEGIELPVDVKTTGNLYDGMEVSYRVRSRRDDYATLWDSIHTRPGTTWDANPDVWVLEFELVKEAVLA
jgi:hypothetical protein